MSFQFQQISQTPEAKRFLRAHTVKVYLETITPTQYASYEACEADVPFACPDCEGSGDCVDRDECGDETVVRFGCSRCGGTGELPRSELSYNDIARAQ